MNKIIHILTFGLVFFLSCEPALSVPLAFTNVTLAAGVDYVQSEFVQRREDLGFIMQVDMSGGAAAGDFDRARRTAQAALALAFDARSAALTSAIRRRLDLYRQGKPYRQATPLDSD